MSPDISQYFLHPFWNFQKIVQKWTLGPLIYYQNTLKIIKKIPGTCLKHIILVYLKILETPEFYIFRVDGDRTIRKIRLRNSRKSWIRDQYLPENMKLNFSYIAT